MNLDITFCAAKCLNDNCLRRLDYEVWNDAELVGRNSLLVFDFSADCPDYNSVKQEDKND